MIQLHLMKHTSFRSAIATLTVRDCYSHMRTNASECISPLGKEVVKICCVYKCRNVYNGEALSIEVFFQFPKGKKKSIAKI